MWDNLSRLASIFKLRLHYLQTLSSTGDVYLEQPFLIRHPYRHLWSSYILIVICLHIPRGRASINSETYQDAQPLPSSRLSLFPILSLYQAGTPHPATSPPFRPSPPPPNPQPQNPHNHTNPKNRLYNIRPTNDIRRRYPKARRKLPLEKHPRAPPNTAQ